MIRRKPARGNDAVNVGMQQQVLSPGVQDARSRRSRRPGVSDRMAISSKVCALAVNNRS